MLCSFIRRIRPLSGCVCRTTLEVQKDPVVRSVLSSNQYRTIGPLPRLTFVNNFSDSKVIQEVDDDEMGEKELDGLTSGGMFIPSEDTMDSLINGVPFKELPIANIRCTRNNTIIGIFDFKGNRYAHSSAGMEGYRNAKKRTEVAAQETGLTAGLRAKKKGVTHVRVLVKGLGNGRLPAIKGLKMAGLNVVSLTDNTPIFIFGPKPRKVRRV